MFAEYGQMFQFVNNSRSRSRIGVIDKAEFVNGMKGSEAVRWFEVEACLVLHVANAWEEEEGDVIRMIAGRFAYFDINDLLHHEAVRKGEMYASTELYEWKLNLKTGAVEEGAVGVDQKGVEMHLVHPLYEARKVLHADNVPRLRTRCTKTKGKVFMVQFDRFFLGCFGEFVWHREVRCGSTRNCG